MGPSSDLLTFCAQMSQDVPCVFTHPPDQQTLMVHHVIRIRTLWPSDRVGNMTMPVSRRLEDLGEPCAGLERLVDLITRTPIEAPNRIPEEKIQTAVDTAGGDSTHRHWQEQV